jgi:DNA-binding winged helix-turn-helix (wHTH) protein
MNHQRYSFKGYLLDPLSRELWREGEAIPLSSSTFDCLVYLVEHRDRPVWRDELISAVWARADVSDSLLAQTIVRLRRALGEDGKEQQTIRTIPRVGYRWMADTEVHTGPPAAEPDINRDTALPFIARSLPVESDGPSSYKLDPMHHRLLIVGAAVAAIVLFACVACCARACRH